MPQCHMHGQWTPLEAVRSSTWRELAAVWFVLLSVANSLTNHHVCWFTDNQNVVRILQIGSKKPDLHVVALKNLTMCIHNQILLKPDWIPRELNEKADYLRLVCVNVCV